MERTHRMRPDVARGLSRHGRRLLRSPLASALARPHGVDRYLELFDPLWSLDQVRAEVMGVRRETADATTLTLRPNDNWRGFRAGQHVQVTAEIDGVRRTRCYSLSSTPLRADGCIEITVQRHPGGRVSDWLVDRARSGTIVTLSQADGTFTLADEPPAELLFISGGSGITPIMSMLRTLSATGHEGRIRLLHFVRRYDDLIFADELRTLARRHAGFELTLSLTRDTPARGDWAGHFNQRTLTRVAPDYHRCLTYLCGPESLLDAASPLWRRSALAHRLHVERFCVPSVRAFGEEVGSIRFAKSARCVPSDGRTLLEQAEAAGLQPAFGCRRGRCQSCKQRKARGTVRDIVTGEQSYEEGESIRLCVSVPVGDVTLDL